MENEQNGETIDSLRRRLDKETAKNKEKERKRNIDRIPVLQNEINSCQEDIKKLEEKILDLDSRLKTKKLKEDKEKLWYLAPLLIVIVFVSYLVYRGWAQTPTVSIDFNVGEIIGGSLVGIGALIAGAAYAFRRQKGD